MLDTHEYYCKLFVNKDIEQRELEILIAKLISDKNKNCTNQATWGDLYVNLNKAAKSPWGQVDDSNFLFWKFFLDIEPLEGTSREEYIACIIKLMDELNENGFQVIAACDFENELPRYIKKDKGLAYRIYPKPNGTTYYASYLKDEDNVVTLFDYCGILEAIVFEAGWDFLLKFYGYEKLFKINKRSGWLDTEDIEVFKQEVEMWIGYAIRANN